jgi:HK97 family phage major capsid protein
MALKEKSRAAGEFRAKAEVIRAELLDETKTFTKDELENKSKEMAALEQRAAIVAGFTAAEEIASQGGDEALKRANIENDDADIETKEYAGEMEKLAKKVRKVFGGPNSYLLALARRHVQHMTAEQEKVEKQVQDLFRRSTIVGTASDASGGEFLLPLQQVQEIFSVENIVSGILEVSRRYPVSGRSLRIPYAVQTNAANTRPLAGIAAVSIVDENASIPEQEPTFQQRILNVYNWKAYSEIGDETLSDDMTGQLAPTLQRMVGGQVMNEMNGYMTIDGNGTAQPTGALYTSNPALIKVPRVTANQITVEDIFLMYSKHTFTGKNSRWLVNRTAIPQLFALKLSGNTLVTFLTNLQGQPVMTLLGIPVALSDLMAPLGSESDISLVNGDFYAAAIREQLTVESSIHYKFKNDLTAYRFKARGGGIPIPLAPYAYKSDGTNLIAAHSPFVTLDDVVAS